MLRYDVLGRSSRSSPVSVTCVRQPAATARSIRAANNAPCPPLPRCSGNVAANPRYAAPSPIQTAAAAAIETRRKIYRIEPVPERTLYLLHNSLPYSSGGYAVRAHGLLRAIRAYGYDAQGVLRPGFPGDRIEDAPPPPPRQSLAPSFASSQRAAASPASPTTRTVPG